MDLTRELFAEVDEATEAQLTDLLGELGRQACVFRFGVAPNPCVGAAVLSDGVEIGRGFHEHWGGSHAEVQALEAAEKSGIPKDRWDTLCVTLEPCSSTAKTPPCTDAIRRAGIRRVVVGATDPDPRHRGEGLRLLREAGVEVVFLPGASPLETVAPHFLDWTQADRIRRPRPWTLAKWAQTRTGQLRPPPEVGEGRWISGPASRAEVQLLRGRVDAILTGIGTVQADDPRLSVRPPGELERPPLRVVLDSELRMSPAARMLSGDDDGPEGASEAGGAVHILARAGASPARHRELLARGAEVHSIRQGDEGQLSPFDVQRWLWDRGVRRLLLEAGPTLLEAFFEAELVDQILVYTGNVNGGLGVSLGDRLDPRLLGQVEHREVGEDAVLEAFCVRRRSRR